ncbi:ABC transporter ATP-binding protein [Clostridium tagluense]|uniref:ABC transporter ATP-binding protein n=1 Tax=Clostridium tagluense TaxID=360422 RepID=UPI001CF33339|nr:ABC transporter ATP-binding protein [Clostridium tagluense]MCB2297506.1 ABC transporter ATP-binding protein [Clostridium tagluense]MCB2312436.1 ABC transporter ATP-binding protein [Clostridium tagluense]MCB2317111.1 ABC transporter ATP-binding protein [Clostridium tagluense]MCB2321975.1 ABC transporter ATP-binding protein [Clostridium tagluense]MCB2326984.1 ABC transporter ATP-binding protein [Clostridium tagluense]
MDIKVENFYFSYNDKSILENINLEFKRGNMYALLGRNGSGKTTLIKLILGLLKFKRGSITIEGKNSYDIPIKDLSRLIAYVPQNEEAIYGIKVIELVVMGRNPYLNLFDMPSCKEYELARKALENLGIEHLAQKSYSEISGGERQLVLIARALVQNTKFILMDEPISNLDIRNQHEVLEKIKNIARDFNIGIVLSIHDPNLAMRYCNQAILLKDGKVLHSGKTEEILCQQSLLQVYDMKFEVLNSKNGINFVSL